MWRRSLLPMWRRSLLLMRSENRLGEFDVSVMGIGGCMGVGGWPAGGPLEPVEKGVHDLGQAAQSMRRGASRPLEPQVHSWGGMPGFALGLGVRSGVRGLRAKGVLGQLRKVPETARYTVLGCSEKARMVPTKTPPTQFNCFSTIDFTSAPSTCRCQIWTGQPRARLRAQAQSRSPHHRASCSVPVSALWDCSAPTSCPGPPTRSLLP
jgi:hypothetical protein